MTQNFKYNPPCRPGNLLTNYDLCMERNTISPCFIPDGTRPFYYKWYLDFYKEKFKNDIKIEIKTTPSQRNYFFELWSEKMNDQNAAKNIPAAVKKYQCTGCVADGENCYKKGNDLACENHVIGTMGINIGKFILGLPNGFNRLGSCENTKINIFQKFEDGWGYNKVNLPVWKHLNEQGHTIVRGMCPRINYPFIHIFLENCTDKIDCLEITKDDINEMD